MGVSNTKRSRPGARRCVRVIYQEEQTWCQKMSEGQIPRGADLVPEDVWGSNTKRSRPGEEDVGVSNAKRSRPGARRCVRVKHEEEQTWCQKMCEGQTPRGADLVPEDV